MVDRAHWETVYAKRDDHELTWFQDRPETSLALIEAHVSPTRTNGVLDVGGGTSRLAEILTQERYGPVTVVDLSEAALERSRRAAGDLAEQITYIAGDITDYRPKDHVGLWHDRAAFHFLTSLGDRRAYADVLLSALRPGGYALISTFADDGPEKCSGLPVRRYSPEALSAEIEQLTHGAFQTVEALRHDHVTPLGNIQKFQSTLLRRTP